MKKKNIGNWGVNKHNGKKKEKKKKKKEKKRKEWKVRPGTAWGMRSRLDEERRTEERKRRRGRKGKNRGRRNLCCVENIVYTATNTGGDSKILRRISRNRRIWFCVNE